MRHEHTPAVRDLVNKVMKLARRAAAFRSLGGFELPVYLLLSPFNTVQIDPYGFSKNTSAESVPIVLRSNDDEVQRKDEEQWTLSASNNLNSSLPRLGVFIVTFAHTHCTLWLAPHCLSP